MRYRYYCLFRPPMPGAFPRGCVELEDFGDRRFVPEMDREAWGWVEYDHPLTKQQIDDYELFPAA